MRDEQTLQSSSNTQYKYSEDAILAELKAYIDKTYNGHYGNVISAFDLIAAAGHSEGFCIGNIIKYATRYGKKNGHNRDDLMKVLHYAVLALNHHNTHHMKVN